MKKGHMNESGNISFSSYKHFLFTTDFGKYVKFKIASTLNNYNLPIKHLYTMPVILSVI